jgi:hypothetical protein
MKDLLMLLFIIVTYACVAIQEKTIDNLIEIDKALRIKNEFLYGEIKTLNTNLFALADCLGVKYTRRHPK